ncbi:MAG: abortive infection family protein [Nitrospiraceae bacterium]
MADLPSNNNFTMHGAREAMSAGFSQIEEHIKAIERAVSENPGLAFDLAKTLIESTCKTILTERKISFAPDDDLPRLFKAVTTRLPFLPPTCTDEGLARKRLAQTLGGLHTSLVGVCELRNSYGFASHGSERQRPIMENAQAILVAQAADTIIGFLHRVHRQDSGVITHGKLEYEDNPELNDFIDSENEPVHIYHLEYKPSEVLFNVDQEAYKDLLANYATPDLVDSDEINSCSLQKEST